MRFDEKGNPYLDVEIYEEGLTNLEERTTSLQDIKKDDAAKSKKGKAEEAERIQKDERNKRIIYDKQDIPYLKSVVEFLKAQKKDLINDIKEFRELKMKGEVKKAMDNLISVTRDIYRINIEIGKIKRS
jgi:hypothetical protein